MPQLDELPAALVALLGLRKDLLGLEIKEAHPHRAVTHDAFEVPYTAAAAEPLLGVERDRSVPPSHTPSTYGQRP